MVASFDAAHIARVAIWRPVNAVDADRDAAGRRWTLMLIHHKAGLP
jgi:hypothetical protein